MGDKRLKYMLPCSNIMYTKAVQIPSTDEEIHRLLNYANGNKKSLSKCSGVKDVRYTAAFAVIGQCYTGVKEPGNPTGKTKVV